MGICLIGEKVAWGGGNMGNDFLPATVALDADVSPVAIGDNIGSSVDTMYLGFNTFYVDPYWIYVGSHTITW